MMLYLVRHGVAKEFGEDGIRSDEERPLSALGRRKTAQVARGLKQLGVTPHRIVTSPLVRARETADIVAGVVAPTVTVEESATLAPTAAPAAAVAWLASQQPATIMLVGHLPHIPELASVLLAGDASVDIRFKKAAACCLSLIGVTQASAARLEWLLQPKQLRLLGNTSRD